MSKSRWYRIGHRFRWNQEDSMGQEGPEVLGMLERLGYKEVSRRQGTLGPIIRYKTPEGCVAQWVMGFRIHLYGPLAHHNAFRQVFDRKSYTHQRAAEVEAKRSW